jgi:hypothetical protein
LGITLISLVSGGVWHWKTLDEGYNFVFDLTSIRGLLTKLWAAKVVKVPLENLETKWHLGASPVTKHREYYKEEGGGFPLSPSRGESCKSVFARGLYMHQKCSSYALTNLSFGLCRSVWIINLLVNFPNPHPRAPTHPSTPKVLRVRERA